MEINELSYSKNKLFFSPQLTKKNKNIIGPPQIENKKKIKIEDINTLSFNFSQSSYNNVHNKTVSNRILNFDKRKFFNNNYSTKNSFSVTSLNDINELFPKYFLNNLKVPKLRNFHNKIMNNNERSVKLTLKKIENENKKEKENNSKNETLNNLKEIKKNKLKEEFDTHKYNLENFLEINKKDNKFLRQYPQKSFDDDIKKIVRNELETIKNKRKNRFRYSCEIPKKKNKRICIQKLERYNFITFNNPIIQLNQSGSVPYVVNDCEIMHKLFKYTVNNCNKRYNKTYMNIK